MNDWLVPCMPASCSSTVRPWKTYEAVGKNEDEPFGYRRMVFPCHNSEADDYV